MKKINFAEINLGKKIKDFIITHKVIVIGVATVFLLACVSFFVSFAYYQVTDKTPIIVSRVGEIPDIDVRIFVQNRGESGNALENNYSLVYHVPRTGYTYNKGKSYCTNNSNLNYSETDYNFTIDTTGTELCFAYFDVDTNVNQVIDVYAQDIDDVGEGKVDDTGKKVYSFTTEADLPIVGYELNVTESKCTNGGTVKYENGKFSVEGAIDTTYCRAYMDSIGVDILLTTYVKRVPGANSTSLEDYYKVKSLPTLPANKHYVINTSLSQCSGTNGTANITLEGQEIVVSSAAKTQCVAVLDIDNGAYIETASLDDNKIQVYASPAGNDIEKWYYSTDEGNNYTEFTNGDTVEAEGNVIIYGTDSAGNESEKVELNQEDNYVYNGIFTNDGTTEEKTITKSGYYYAKVFATDESSTTGHYIEGYVYLNENDVIYVTLGKEPNVSATLSVNGMEEGNILMHRDMDNSYVYTPDNAGSSLLNSNYYVINSNAQDEEIAGNGYVVVTYVGETLE